MSATLVGLALITFGCRSNPNEMLLERDLRCQEDKIYHLQAMLEDCQAAREATCRENEELKRQLGKSGASADTYREPSSERLPSDQPPGRSRRAPAPKLEAPKIELPEETDSSNLEIPSREGSSAAAQGQPSDLVINARMTGGMDRDGRDGDEGLLLVVEPRDSAGKLVRPSGTISVALMDYALEGNAQRLARWDFAPHELPQHFRNASFGGGLQFELPWPGASPQHRDLHLHVRYKNARGVKLETDSPIQVRMPGDPVRVVDRDSEDRSHSESATQPPRKSAPGSRLKSTRGKSASLDDADGEDESPDDLDPRSRPAARQASRPDRPVWQPYR